LHDSPENKAFVTAFEKANDGMRPNLMAVQAYDGMHMIYEALKETGGNTDGDALVAAMANLSWINPRGPVRMDPTTREMIQNIYIRTVQRRDGELYNVEVATIPRVSDPSKSAN
jgi:branched-chain amino acid transport system substrate-binding protein